MKTQAYRILMIAMLALLVGAAGCSNDESNLMAPVAGGAEKTGDGPDIVDVAIGAGDFDILVAAVQAAELEDALRGEGPLTVFAPTDEAFGKLPDGLVEQLLLPRNKGKLQELLLYHVVAGEIYSGDLRRFQFTETLSGKYLWIRKFWRGTVKVNNARVIAADISASNGVIHAVNEVIIPRGFELEPEEPMPTDDIVDTAIGADDFNTLVAAVIAADLVDALRSDGPLTVFAPTDEAFGKLPAGLVDALLLPENKGKLQELLLYHVAAGQTLSGDLSYYQRVPTLQGDKVRIVKWFGNVWVNWSKVIQADVVATNGVIHVINRVLIPPRFTLEMNGATVLASELETEMTATDRQELPPTEFELQYLDPVN